MNKIDKIKNIVLDFQQKQDKLYSRYQASEKEARSKFSEQGFKTEFMLNTWPQYAGKAQANADSTIREVSYLLDEAQEEFDAWVMRPLDANVVSMLNSISSFNLSLSMQELKIIEQKISGAYLGMRIFAGLCEKNGYSIQIPTADKYIEALKHARVDIELAVRAYAGKAPSYEGRDLIGDWIFEGISQGPYQDFHLYIASNFLHENGTLDRLAELWDSSNAPLQYTLNPLETEKVKKQLDKIVDHGEIDKKAADELTKAEPNFINKLLSMPEGSMKGYEAVSKHFNLTDNKKEKAQESRISPSMEMAAQYASSRQPIDESLLAKFK